MAIYTNTWDYRKKLERIAQWNIPDSEKDKLIEYANEYASGRITGRIGKNIDGSIEDSLTKLKLPLSFIKKSIDDITEDDLKHFVDCLFQDRIRKRVRKKVDGRLQWVEAGTYQKKGKDKFLKNLALYLRFRLADDPEKLAGLLRIVRVVITHTEKETRSLSYEDFDEIYGYCSTLCDRYYMVVNAWGGFRASEFHGVRESDIHLPNQEEGEEFVRIWIRHANSKTRGRMVTLYGPDCHRIVLAYLEKRRQDGLGSDEPVFEKSHNSRKLWLRRLGKKSSLHLHPHLFRSTCATWLVDKGILRSYTDLIEFFGWAYGSTTPNRYLNRGGIQLRHIDDNVKRTRLEELTAEVEKQREINRLQKFTGETDRVTQEQRIARLETEREQTNKLVKQLIQKVTQLQASFQADPQATH